MNEDKTTVRRDDHLQAIVARVNESERRGAIARRGHLTRKAGRLLDDAYAALRVFQLNPGRADDSLEKANRILREARSTLALLPRTPAVRRHAERLDILAGEANRFASMTVEELIAENDTNRPAPQWTKFRRQEENR